MGRKTSRGLRFGSPPMARMCFLLAFLTLPAMWMFMLRTHTVRVVTHKLDPRGPAVAVTDTPTIRTTTVTQPATQGQGPTTQPPAVAQDGANPKTNTDATDAAALPMSPFTNSTVQLEIPQNLMDAFSADGTNSRPFRVLFVSEVDVYMGSMSRWFFHLFAAMRALPGIEAHLWGPGFAGYDDSQTVAANVARRWGRASYFDFFMNNTVHRNTARVWLGNGEGAPPVAVWHHECMLFEKLPTRDMSKLFSCSHEAEVVFHAYANHMAYYAEQAAGKPRLLWHLPHAAHTPMFHSPTAPHGSRPIDVLIVGNIWSVYPLRVKFLKLYDERRLPGRVYRLVHPGYWFDAGPNGTTTGATAEQQEAAARKAEHQTAAYIQALQSAKIVLVCSSKRHYAVRKYVEAAAAGALVIADVPGEREEEFRSYVVEVRPTDTEDTIIRTIRWWLDHATEREARAAAGQKIALSRYTTVHAAESAVKAMQAYLIGRRGLFWQYPFDIPDLYLPQTRPCSRSLQQLLNAKQQLKTKQ